MNKYKLSKTGVINLETMAHIPDDVSNPYWQEYLEWVAQGNEPLPMNSLAERQDICESALTDKMVSIQNGQLLFEKTKIDSTPDYINMLNSHANVSNKDKSLSVSMINLDGTHIILDKNMLDNFCALGSKLYSLCSKNYALLSEEIYNSNDPESIDINSGWPIVPFDGK
jgi:hypothetical protein